MRFVRFYFLLCLSVIVAFGSVTVIVIERPRAVAVEPEKTATLTLDSSLIDGALTNFPVLVSLTASSGINSTNLTAIFTELGTNYSQLTVKNAGGDSLFVEVEQWQSPTNAQLWVNVPSVASGADTVLTLNYTGSNPVSTNIGVVGSPPGELVWRAAFKGVWHISEGGTGTRFDSTSNDNDGTPENYDGDEYAQGQIDGCDDLDGVDQSIETGIVNITPNLAVFGWMYGAADGVVIAKYDWGNGRRSWTVVFDHNNHKLLVWLCDNGTAGAGHVKNYYSSLVVPDNTWTRVGFTFAAGDFNIYVNGVLDPNPVKNPNDSITFLFESVLPVHIGMMHSSDNPAIPFAGKLDEQRVMDVTPTLAEIKASYNSEKDSLITYVVN